MLDISWGANGDVVIKFPLLEWMCIYKLWIDIPLKSVVTIPQHNNLKIRIKKIFVRLSFLHNRTDNSS